MFLAPKLSLALESWGLKSPLSLALSPVINLSDENEPLNPLTHNSLWTESLGVREGMHAPFPPAPQSLLLDGIPPMSDKLITQVPGDPGDLKGPTVWSNAPSQCSFPNCPVANTLAKDKGFFLLTQELLCSLSKLLRGCWPGWELRFWVGLGVLRAQPEA